MRGEEGAAMTDAELIEAMFDAYAMAVDTPQGRMRAALAIAAPEIRRRALLEMAQYFEDDQWHAAAVACRAVAKAEPPTSGEGGTCAHQCDGDDGGHCASTCRRLGGHAGNHDCGGAGRTGGGR